MPFEPAHQADVRSQMGREQRRNAQRTVFDARQRLTSSTGTRASFDFELLDGYADSRISGALLIAIGILMITGSMTTLTTWLQAWTPEALKNRI